MGFLDSLNEALDAVDEVLGEDEVFDPTFQLVNDTEYDINEVYVSSSDSDDWEEDVMGEDILEAGARLNVNFNTDSRKRYWDIKVVDEEGDENVFEHFDLSRVHTIVLTYNGDGEMEAEYQY